MEDPSKQNNIYYQIIKRVNLTTSDLSKQIEKNEHGNDILPLLRDLLT